LERNQRKPFKAVINNHKLIELGPMVREVSLQYVPDRLAYLKAIKTEEINPHESINIILEGFGIKSSDIDTIQYLAIGRHVIWMLCDTRIVPFKGPSNPSCWDIMIQAHQEDARPQSTPTVNQHQIESRPERVLRSKAEHVLEVLYPALTDFYGYLGFACIFPRAAINFPCDKFHVEIPYPQMSVRWMKVGIPDRFLIPD
jgi:hypothetical protein